MSKTPLTNSNPPARQPKKYATVYADPPWPTHQRGKFGANQHYDLMSIDAIKTMPIQQLSLPDSHCWLWVTTATLETGIQVLRSWDYEYKGFYFWGKLRFTLGTYLRNAGELLLLGVRGNCPMRFHSQPNWGVYPLQDHSHKPEEIHQMLERLSPTPYLELFARRRPSSSADWSVWGNEIDSDLVIPGYPVPSDQYHQLDAGSVPPESPHETA
jgi:N6-adenosine-specific RNA methylase IME4